MNWRDKRKLIKRGFIIIRERDYNPVSDGEGDGIVIHYPYRIYYCSGNSSWKLLDNHRYKTKLARRYHMNLLLGFDNHIED